MPSLFRPAVERAAHVYGPARSRRKENGHACWFVDRECYIKAYFHNTTVDPVCLGKVDLKFNQAFTRAENPGLCDPGNVGNAAAVAALVDQFVGDVLNAIPPP